MTCISLGKSTRTTNCFSSFWSIKNIKNVSHVVQAYHLWKSELQCNFCLFRNEGERLNYNKFRLAIWMIINLWQLKIWRITLKIPNPAYSIYNLNHWASKMSMQIMLSVISEKWLASRLFYVHYLFMSVKSVSFYLQKSQPRYVLKCITRKDGWDH